MIKFNPKKRLIMKVIQQRELERICMMIKSDDTSMRDLAITILQKGKNFFRFSLLTISILHSVLFITSLTFVIYVSHKYHIQEYIAPMIFGTVLQFLISIVYVLTIHEHRSKYNSMIQKLRE